MRDTGEASELLFQPINAGRGGVAEGLERHDLAAGEIVNLIDDAHSARTQTSKHRKALRAGKIIVCERRRRRKSGRSLQERAGPLMRVQQALQFGVKRGIVRACVIEVA